jgi:two-component system, OmpR family, osmolarity sensor histidine kinase EnvZ
MLRIRRLRLRDRIGLIVLLHAMMMVGTVILFSFSPTAGQTKRFFRLPDPQKVALVATAFEHTPPRTHADLARAFSDATLDVRLLDGLPRNRLGPISPEALARYEKALGGRPFRVETFGDRMPADFGTRPGFSPDAVRVSVELPDGHAVAVQQMVIAPIAKLIDNRLLFLLVVLLVDIAIILWLARQTTRPVERLARAVREDRLDTLKPGGPREIVELGEAFGQLRHRLRDLMQERTRMLAAIAHDYRTYLTRIDLRGEFIEDEQQRALAAQDVEEMRHLLSDTLTFARESSTDEIDDAVCDVGGELAAIVAERRGRGEDVGVVPILKPVFAHASHVSFQRMLANLLDNAVRYGGGRAFMRVRVDRQIVYVLVEDEGPGVPEASLGRLLEPFERLEPSRARHTGGVGLGLSIVQALAHRYQGDLSLENRKEGGFRAILTLRAAEAPSAR